MSRLDRTDWLRGAQRLLATGGVEAVKVEPLAKALGVTKGSFYWHFDDRPALLQALLDHWVEIDTERVIELVGAAPEDPGAALHRLLELSFASDDSDGVETAIRTWAVTDPEVARITADVDEHRVGYVTGLLMSAGIERSEAEQRAHLLYRVLIGEYMWRRYGGAPLDVTVVHTVVDRLLTP